MKILREDRQKVRFRHSRDYLLKHNIRSKRYVGLDALRAAASEVRYWVDDPSVRGRISEDNIEYLYTKFVHARYDSTMGPYFRILHTIMERIDEDSSISNKQKDDYSRLFRSQLSSYDAFCMGVNGLASYSGRMKILIEKQHMLRFLPEGNPKHLLARFYDKTAFEKRDP
jgi:hypothetical protein